MQTLLNRLAACIECGKCDRTSAYPPEMKGEDGASEITVQLLEAGIHPNQILQHGLMVGMNRIGDQFAQGAAFLPQLLVAAKAMKASMNHLKPYFESGIATHRGVIVIGTVAGDLHDIGKNIVGMVLEGDGWQVVDLGVDVPADRFLSALREYPNCMVGLSALLTTTMDNMKDCVARVKAVSPSTRVFVGGAPVTAQFGLAIGADGYFPDPGSFARHLSQSLSSHSFG